MGLMTKKRDQIPGLLYEYSEQAFTVREIAKRTGIPKSTAQKYLQELKKKGFIDQENKAISSLLFKIKKVNYYVEKIIESGLIDELIRKLNPSCIILFGSIRKGDSAPESDIDLFVESPLAKELALEKYEKILHHPLQLFIEKDIQGLPPQLFNNVVNGIKLYGSFKVK